MRSLCIVLTHIQADSTCTGLIGPMFVLFCVICYYHFIMTLEDADSCQKQQVVKMMRTISFSPLRLIDSEQVLTGALMWKELTSRWLVELVDVYGIPEFISLTDYERTSNSVSNQ